MSDDVGTVDPGLNRSAPYPEATISADRGLTIRPDERLGLPQPSDTYNPRDQGTDWPLDPFTALVVGPHSDTTIATPAKHSYDGDANMESFRAFPPFSHQEDATNLARYTGANGPAGAPTPEHHPEVTAP